MPLAALLFAAAAEIPLAELEHWVGRYHDGGAAVLHENAPCLKEGQESWRRTVRACRDDACRRAAHLERLAELHPLQPGINLKRELPLPARPGLVWAIGPALDPMLRPKVDSKVHSATGRLAYRGDTYSGHFIEAGPEERYLLVDDMGLEGATALALPTIAELNRAHRIAASGRVARDGRNPYFDRRFCILLHRLP